MHNSTKRYMTNCVRKTQTQFGNDEAARFSPSWYVDCCIEGFNRAMQRGLKNMPHYQDALIIKNDIDNNRSEVETFIAGLLGMM